MRSVVVEMRVENEIITIIPRPIKQWLFSIMRHFDHFWLLDIMDFCNVGKVLKLRIKKMSWKNSWSLGLFTFINESPHSNGNQRPHKFRINADFLDLFSQCDLTWCVGHRKLLTSSKWSICVGEGHNRVEVWENGFGF